MDQCEVLVIGGGQAGLGVGYRLRQAGFHFVVVDAHARTGDSWRERWDSLELFTPRPFDGMPGLAPPPSMSYYPRKDEIADYLEDYCRLFELPVRHNFPVLRLEKADDRFIASGPNESVQANAVVAATGAFQAPRIPECAGSLDGDVWQCHSSGYRRPSEVPPGEVLVVGGGNSAAQIAEELAAHRPVSIASDGPIPMSPKTIAGVSIFWFLKTTRLLSADRDNAIAARMRPYSDTVIGLGLRKLVKSGRVAHIPHRVVGCAGDEVAFADGSRRRFRNILWCTGFRADTDWIKIDGALDDAGAPRHTRGVSPVPGLFWQGLPWQNALNSALINGVERESGRMLRLIAGQ